MKKLKINDFLLLAVAVLLILGNAVFLNPKRRDSLLMKKLRDAPMVLGQRYSFDEVSEMFNAQKGGKFTSLGTLILTVPDYHPPILLFAV